MPIEYEKTAQTLPALELDLQGERICRHVEGWFLSEPLLFSVWMTHRLVRRTTGTLRAGELRIEYNPAFVATIPDGLLGDLLHVEALRLAFGHPYRRPFADPALGYQASNLTIREHLPSGLPNRLFGSVGWYLPSARQIFGTNAHDQGYFERYYELLKTAENQGKPQKARRGDPQGNPALTNHFSKEMAGDNTELWQEDSLALAELRECMLSAKAAGAYGNVPLSLREEILANLAPRLGYREVLRGFHASILSAKAERTRMRPSRRYEPPSLGHRRPLCSRLLMAVDVSGSISKEELRLSFSVVNRFFLYGVEQIDLIQFDTEVKTKVQTLRRGMRMVKVFGRGGTDFGCVFRFVQKDQGTPQKNHYDGLIILTDGDGQRPEPLRGWVKTQVLWLFPNREGYLKMRHNVEHIGRATYLSGRSGS